MVSKANYIDKTKGLYLGFCAKVGHNGYTVSGGQPI